MPSIFFSPAVASRTIPHAGQTRRTRRWAINRGENADVLEEIALTHGMKTLRMSAIDYALRGITTVEEVQRVAYDDEED